MVSRVEVEHVLGMFLQYVRNIFGFYSMEKYFVENTRRKFL